MKPFKLEEICVFIFVGYWIVALSTPAWGGIITDQSTQQIIRTGFAAVATVLLAAGFTKMVYDAETTAQRIRRREAIQQEQTAPQEAPQVGKE